VGEAEEPLRLAKVVTRLVRDEGVSGERRWLAALAPFRRIGEYPVTADTSGPPRRPPEASLGRREPGAGASGGAGMRRGRGWGGRALCP
jgi:hypothetical protein